MRKRILRPGLFAAAALVLVTVGVPAEEIEKSPHAVALELVFTLRSADIRALETGDWWSDTQERTWRVTRPFAPGYFDSTHWFNVEYEINGKRVANWFVDTEKGTVEPALEKEGSK